MTTSKEDKRSFDNSGNQESEWPKFASMGDSSLMVSMGEGISLDTNDQVRVLTHDLMKSDWPGVREIVPTYSSIAIHYDPFILSEESLEQSIRNLMLYSISEDDVSNRIIMLPTLYGGEFGPDLESVCTITGLSQQDAVRIHSGSDYRVYALGFSPGFPYLGGLSEKLHCPRLDSPRTEVPMGSVAIAGTQTGVYPVSSPGGWRLIGRTPLVLFDPYREDPAIFRSGDHLRFVPIKSEKEFDEISNAVQSNSYELEVIVG